MKAICIWCARRFEADAPDGYTATDAECPRCIERRRALTPDPTPPRPMWRVIARPVGIILVLVVYLLILWPIGVSVWTYWSEVVTTEKTMDKGKLVSDPASCLNKAADDEPVFLVRAKDPEAAETVRTWASNARTRGTHEPEKISEAFALADQMEAYRKEKFPPPPAGA